MISIQRVITYGMNANSGVTQRVHLVGDGEINYTIVIKLFGINYN